MANVINLSKDENFEQLMKALPSTQQSKKSIDVQRYSGVITLKEDPVEYQKRMKNEWN